MKNLIPCPFCGGDAELRAESTRNRYKFVAGCCECPAIAGGSAFENKEYNTKAWNTRATSSDSELVKEIDEYFDSRSEHAGFDTWEMVALLRKCKAALEELEA